MDVFGLKEFNITTNYGLALIKHDDSVLRYKDGIENRFSDSKYPFLKHLNKVNSLNFIFIINVVNLNSLIM